MKKFLSLCLLSLVVVSCVRAEDDMPAVEEVVAPRVLTVEEQELCQRFYDKLSACYAQLETHSKIAHALQEVADENRADFEKVRDLVGATLEDGTPVFPLNISVLLQ